MHERLQRFWFWKLSHLLHEITNVIPTRFSFEQNFVFTNSTVLLLLTPTIYQKHVRRIFFTLLENQQFNSYRYSSDDGPVWPSSYSEPKPSRLMNVPSRVSSLSNTAINTLTNFIFPSARRTSTTTQAPTPSMEDDFNDFSTTKKSKLGFHTTTARSTTTRSATINSFWNEWSPTNPTFVENNHVNDDSLNGSNQERDSNRRKTTTDMPDWMKQVLNEHLTNANVVNNRETTTEQTTDMPSWMRDVLNEHSTTARSTFRTSTTKKSTISDNPFFGGDSNGDGGNGNGVSGNRYLTGITETSKFVFVHRFITHNMVFVPSSNRSCILVFLVLNSKCHVFISVVFPPSSLFWQLFL